MANTFVFDDEEQPEPDAGPGPESSDPGKPEGGEGSNRNFLIAAIVLGGIVLLSLVCMAVYALLIMPGQKASAQATSSANAVASTEMAFMQFQTQEASLFTPTLPPSETPVPEPTETLVVVFASATASVVPTLDPATATLEAMLTQVAENAKTTATGTPGAITGTPGTAVPGKDKLAKTGIADELGLPGLFIAFMLVIAVILLARRLRQGPRQV